MKSDKKQFHYLIFILIGLLIGLFLKLFIIDLVSISGNSMFPALKDGQKVFVSKISYGIVKPFTSDFIYQYSECKKNDVIIFLVKDKMMVKRCVATQKTLLEYIEKSGYYLKIEDLLIPLNSTQFEYLSEFHEVPSGMILAIGDNYEDSVDSRDFGFIPVKNVIGKVLCK